MEKTTHFIITECHHQSWDLRNKVWAHLLEGREWRQIKVPPCHTICLHALVTNHSCMYMVSCKMCSFLQRCTNMAFLCGKMNIIGKCPSLVFTRLNGVSTETFVIHNIVLVGLLSFLVHQNITLLTILLNIVNFFRHYWKRFKIVVFWCINHYFVVYDST